MSNEHLQFRHFLGLPYLEVEYMEMDGTPFLDVPRGRGWKYAGRTRSNSLLYRRIRLVDPKLKRRAGK